MLAKKGRPQREHSEDVVLRYRDSEITNCQKILKNLV